MTQHLRIKQRTSVDVSFREDAPIAPSANQRRSWFLDQYESDPTAHYLCSTLKLPIRLDDACARAAVAAAVRRHPELMQQFEQKDGGLQCRTVDAAPHFDVDHVSTIDDAELQRLVRLSQMRALDVRAGHTAAFHLIRSDALLLLVIRLHPCVADSVSLRLFGEELLDVLSPGHDLEPGGGAASAAEASTDEASAAKLTFDKRRVEAHGGYWTDRIGIDPPPLALPVWSTRPAKKRADADAVRTQLPAETAARLASFCAANGVAVENAFLAGFLVLLHRWSQQETVILGRTVDTRPSTKDRSIGPLENLLPFRMDFAAPTSFAELVKHVEAHVEGDDMHAGVHFDEIVSLVQKSRDPSRSPVFQALYRFADTAPLTGQSEHGLVQERVDFRRQVTPYDVELAVEHLSDVTSLTLLFDPALFERAAMDSLMRHFVNLLQAFSCDADQIVDQVAMLDADDERRQLESFNSPEVVSPTRTVPALFAATAQRHPDAPAVTFDSHTWSYRDLDEATDRIAASLRDLGVAKNVCVGVCLPRSLEMVATVLGVLKAGGAYVPMDPAYPAERLAMMAEDADARIIIRADDANSPLPLNRRVLTYESLASQTAVPWGLEAVADVESLAYVIFTSGSTGRPKGVAMPHRALVNLIDWQLDRETFVPGARVLQYSSLSFDVSFQEIFSTFASAGHLFLIADEARRDPRRLLEALQAQQIQRLFLPYVALRQLVEAARSGRSLPASLQEVITAGEQLRVDDPLRDCFAALDGASLDNQYGPSETHVITAHLLKGEPRDWPTLPPIGVPIRNNQAYILDRHGGLLPEGAVGELYLGGVNVAHGYIGRDELTQERFVPDPFAARDGAAMYRTGDLARYRPDGSIEFLGRADHQVKIRGHRIEPGEINAVLAQDAGVRQCLTTAIDDARGGKRLVAYVWVDDPAHFDVGGLAAHARTLLPDYMVPAVILPVDHFPFTPSGKVDVRGLPPVPDGSHHAAPPVAEQPRTATQLALAEVWRKALQVEHVGIKDSFFDLGGDSLKAVEVFLAIEKQFGQDLPLALLAESPTIESLASILDDGGSHAFARYKSLRLIQRGDDSIEPLFMVHGGGGNVVLFRTLASGVSKRLPVYAFEWDGWRSRRSTRTIEEMANLYVSELRTFRPQGPYRLGGHCIGGLIAMEMSRQLQAQGETVIGPLIVTDAPNLAAKTHRVEMPEPGSRGACDLESMKQRLAAKLAESEPLDEPPYADPERSVTYQRVVRMIGRAHRLIGRSFNRWQFQSRLDHWIVAVCVALRLQVPLQFRSLHCSQVMVAAANAYRARPYDGDVVYFRTQAHLGEQMGLPGWWEDLEFGFGELLNGRRSLHFINATHNGVVAHPTTARVVREALRVVG